MKMTLIVTILRCLAVLPGSLLLAMVCLFPLHWILYLVVTRFVEVYPEMPERILVPGVLSGVFVWAGSRIAPHYKFETSVALFGIWMSLIGGVVFLTLGDGNWFGGSLYFQGGGIPTVMAIAGAAIGLVVARSENMTAQSAETVI